MSIVRGLVGALVGLVVAAYAVAQTYAILNVIHDWPYAIGILFLLAAIVALVGTPVAGAIIGVRHGKRRTEARSGSPKGRRITSCDYCEQDTHDGVSRIELPGVLVAGPFTPVRYGEEAAYGGVASVNRCAECGTPAGGFHHPGCAFEQCPRCGGQAISCDCERPGLGPPEGTLQQKRTEHTWLQREWL